MKINITATAESVKQAEALLEAGVDTLYIGDKEYALRLPAALSQEEIAAITELAHAKNKEVTVAVNDLMHPDKMKHIRDYLNFLQAIGVDQISVGDVGVIYVLQEEKYRLSYIYEASTLVASGRQVNFWANQGAVAAVLARELPKIELEKMAGELQIPAEILVYGATEVHHSKRPLLQNYFNFAKVEGVGKSRDNYHFIADPVDKNSHYSIFEDEHGTHIFANDDLNMMTALQELSDMGYHHWKLNGIFTQGQAFVEIVKVFQTARLQIEKGDFTSEEALQLEQIVRKFHPENRTLSRGFYDIDPDSIR